MIEFLSVIEFLAALIFMVVIIVCHVRAEMESRKRAEEAIRENAKPWINRTLEDARRLGCPL